VKDHEIESILQQFSREEMKNLIHRMFVHSPELTTLLEATPQDAKHTYPLLDTMTITNQVKEIFVKSDGEKNPHAFIASDVQRLIENAKRYVYLNDWLNAAIVYQVIAHECFYDDEVILSDHEDHVKHIVEQCITGMHTCLPGVINTDIRGMTFETLFDIYHWDVTHNGPCLAHEIPAIIQLHATEEEKSYIAEWVQEAFEQAPDESKTKQSFYSFLQRLARR